MQCPNCRAALPNGSRFCNVCGSAIGAAPQPAPQHRTQMPGPPQAQRTQMPYGQQPAPPPGYPPAGPQAYAAIPAEPRKKPIALLLGILVLLLAGVVGACVMVAGGKNGGSLLAGKVPFVPSGSGVTQAPNPTAPPSGPAVVAAPGAVPPPSGRPVTGAPKAPDGMAPSVLMAPNASPHKGGNVVVAPSVQTPNAPPMVSAPNVTTPKAPPVTAAPNVQPRPSAPMVAQQAPPDPAMDPAIERYLRWLHYVEDQREQFHQAGVNESMAQMQQFFSVLLNPDDPSFDQKMAQYAQPQAQYVRLLQKQNIFWTNFKRTKPPVPEACRYLDNYYEQAGVAELQMSAGMLDAFNRKDYGRVQSLASNGPRPITDNLKKADRELEKVLDICRKPRWYIDTGGGQSGISGLLGL